MFIYITKLVVGIIAATALGVAERDSSLARKKKGVSKKKERKKKEKRGQTVFLSIK
ncbi:MAG: hypothetical protein GXP28_08170 [Planctomycetes bacterium]|nr:hypothetical protein [Planctomycetota bacterium]